MILDKSETESELLLKLNNSKSQSSENIVPSENIEVLKA